MITQYVFYEMLLRMGYADLAQIMWWGLAINFVFYVLTIFVKVSEFLSKL